MEIITNRKQKHNRIHKTKSLFFKKIPLAKLIKKNEYKNDNLGIKDTFTAVCEH